MPPKGIKDFLPGLLYFDDGNGFKPLFEAKEIEYVTNINSDDSDKERHVGMRSFTAVGQFDRTLMNQLMLAYIFGKSNNWRKMHKIPMKRRGRHKNWK